MSSPRRSHVSHSLKNRPLRLSQDDIHAVFIRPDPPVDEQYLTNTWLLDHLPRSSRSSIILPAYAPLMKKYGSAQFKNIMPPTIISANKEDLLDFIAKHKNIIAKPTNAFGGQGVFHIEKGNTNTKVILETLTGRYNKPLSSKNIFPNLKTAINASCFWAEKSWALCCACMKTENTATIFLPAANPCPPRSMPMIKKSSASFKPHLQKLGLYFVGIDILGDYLIEVNVTSPTCLQEMNRLYNVKLEEKVIDFVEKNCVIEIEKSDYF